MCRKPAERLAAVLALSLVGLVGLGEPAIGQSSGEVFVLRPDVQKRLAALQSDWLDWLTAVQGGDAARAERAALQLLDRAANCGLERLPELSIAASARAATFAEEGRVELAERSLALAESLDPGRPETAFAGARANREKGAHLAAAGSHLRGLFRLARLPETRYVVLGNLSTWLLNSLALAALAFIGVQMATHGQLLYRDLSQPLSRSLPAALGHLLTLTILVWPVLLPAGLLWLIFFWSILLWGYGRRGERLALVALWIVLGAVPFLVSEQVRRMDLAMSRPMRAVQNVSQGRLEGQLFADLRVLADLLPESTAVKHLMADLHLRLRQFDEARSLYRQVLEEEPAATAALSDLGIGLFYEGDFAGAVTVLEDAVLRPNTSAEAFFILGRAYAEQLRFNKQAPMTQRASQMADVEVREWLQADVSERVISVAGGFERGPEIQRELAAVWREGSGDSSLLASWRRVLSLPLVLVFILPAVALNLLQRRARNRSRRIDTVWAEGEAETARRVFLPGILEAEEGRPLTGLASLVLVLALLTLLVRSLGYTLPLGYDPGFGALSWLAIAGLLLYAGIRFRRSWLRPRRG